MKKTKMEKGITLIALIITIVVLLILAVVTIGAIRESSIITHAQNASDDYTTAQEKEQLQLALSEWQLQKNTSGNTQNFKATVKSSLGESANVTGSDNGPLTITFTKTGKTYKLSQDGTIGESAKLTGTALEKYIFGKDLQGRDISEIMDMSEMAFDDENVQFVTYGADVISDIEILCDFYIKNSDSTYKFKIIYNDDEGTFRTTQPYYGLTKIEVAGERVGKTVSYDNKTWTILYDDATNGLQMISNEVYDNFYLGRNDSSITNWNSLITTADLDGNGSLNDLEKAIYSYNNAITTLNTACENLFKDEDGNYKNSNIIDVRCVGSNPTSKNSENATPYTSENLAKWPENDSTYSAGIGNGRGKSTDYNYVTDFDRMVALGTYIGYNSSNEGEDCWLASRLVEEYSSGVDFGVRYVKDDGTFEGRYLWRVRGSNASGYDDDNALRPVVSLRSNVQLQETESGSTTDYILN